MSDRVGSRCSMGTLVLSGPPTQLDQAHKNLTPDPGYDYDAAYDDEYPPQQPYPHPGIRGLQVTVPHQLTHAFLPLVQYGGDGRQYAAGGLPNPPQWGYEEEGYGGGYGEDEEGELDNRAG